MFGNKGTKKFYRTGGTRGGQDQFKWDDVKADKYRENYLGHSVQAPVGRWQKGKDLNWYSKSKEEQQLALREEREKMKLLDDDLLNESLGIKTSKKWTTKTALDSDDLKQLLARGNLERDDKIVERIKGVGAAPSKFHDHIERKSRVELEIERLQNKQTSTSSVIIDSNNGEDLKFIKTDNQNETRRKDSHRDLSDKDDSSESGEDYINKKKRHKKEKKEKKSKKQKK